MNDTVSTPELAPIDELLALVPEIKTAKDRQRLGTALAKATATANRLADLPDQLEDLAILMEALPNEKTGLKAEIGTILVGISTMARRLAGELPQEDLDNINGQGLVLLPPNVEKIAFQIEAFWTREINQALGGQAALGAVLSAISGVQALGKDILQLAERAARLSQQGIAATKRVAEREALFKEAEALEAKIKAAGIEPDIADFLMRAAAGSVRLSQLDDQILAWIRDNGAADLMFVSARSQ